MAPQSVASDPEAPEEAFDDSGTNIVVYDDPVNKVGTSEATQLVMRYGSPSVAAGVAVFGLGLGALPLLAACDGKSSQGAAAPRSKGLASPGSDELRSRLGALDPDAVAAELQMTSTDLAQKFFGIETEEAKTSHLDDEVQCLQRWHDEAVAGLSRLEKRAALGYLGLDQDAEPEAVQKCYKQRALVVHPDKGGNQEDFQQLQEMCCRLQDEDDESGGKKEKSNFFKDLAAKCAKKDTDEDTEDLAPHLKLWQRRQKLHDKTMEIWQRADAAQRELAETLAGRVQSKPIFASLHQFVDSFRLEAECLPRGAGAAASAERLLCKFMRQGLEVLTAAALADAQATVGHVALHLTSGLLQKVKGSGPCPSLERRCQGLLAALFEVPKTFESFLANLRERIDNQAAGEWKGCDESLAPGVAAADAKKNSAAVGGGPALEKAAGEPISGKPRISEPLISEAVALVTPSSDELQSCDSRTEADRTWQKLRAYCMRHRICVDFQRDETCLNGIRCLNGNGRDCAYKHVCAICGAEEGGAPGSQYRHHGGMNCIRLSAWLMSYK